MSGKRIKRNAIQCLKCGDIVESKNRYSIVMCSCETVAVSGGRDYLKRYGPSEMYVELTEYEEPAAENNSMETTLLQPAM